MYFDMQALSGRQRSNLVHSTVLPRPIAWVSSRNAEGELNVAPFSFFNAMSGDPPVLCFCVGSRDGVLKDTARNIAAHGEFVVNLVSSAQARRMVVTSIDFDTAVDESVEAGLAMAPGRLVDVPRIQDSPASMECRVRQLVDIDARRTLVIGDIVGMHLIDESVTDTERMFIDPLPMQLIGRLHNPGWYGEVTHAFQMPAPSLAQWRDMQHDGLDQQYLDAPLPVAPVRQGPPRC
ncbi:flavin reductase family protein [Burkholderia sp. D-99]|uniref:flavin reductase family protein n=1 Tax=unclassified Burkholderia TaxID=2613784 RepID=UPI00141DD907|nr:flavin reductase family protein [Burkholderia sp. D-99]NHV28361.1 flavin reductase family protein [Burkholderia sp. D-99]